MGRKAKVELRVLHAEPLGGGIIERLEHALELAKDGKLSSVAIALVYRDGCPGALWSSAPSVTLLIGSVARLQHQITASVE